VIQWQETLRIVKVYAARERADRGASGPGQHSREALARQLLQQLLRSSLHGLSIALVSTGFAIWTTSEKIAGDVNSRSVE
jgi:hypothetical protein